MKETTFNAWLTHGIVFVLGIAVGLLIADTSDPCANSPHPVKCERYMEENP